MSEPTEPTTLADMRKVAQDALHRGVVDRRHPARNPTLGTIGADGPQMRTVVLRGWDGRVAEMHTDRASAKVAELGLDPRAALHVWIRTARLQLRLSGPVELVQDDADRWARVPDGARRVYGGNPAPGQPMADPEDFAENPTLGRFTVLLLRGVRLEVLHLGDALHRRAVFRLDAPTDAGTWVAP